MGRRPHAREDKVPWRALPAAVRDAVEDTVGAPVRRSRVVYGGYGPSVTLRLWLADGRVVFAKGAGPHSLPGNWAGVAREQHLYESTAITRRFGPAYYGAVCSAGTHLLLLEDLRGAYFPPPWPPRHLRSLMAQVQQLHMAGVQQTRVDDRRVPENVRDAWGPLLSDGPERRAFLALFSDPGIAARWLDETGGALQRGAAFVSRTEGQPWGLMHLDLRSDNLAFRPSGQLVVFDWAQGVVAPAALDVAAFLPSVAAEGGPPPETLWREYAEAAQRASLPVPDWAISGAAAAIAGFFAARAGLPPLAGLPRLRWVQQRQLAVALPWAARRLGLPLPPSFRLATG